ncbi:MAG: pyridoxamine 5'-phosphate oxidase family protein [Ilumatobacter sp.]|uniref:pyridoxamine 5'-phosphate oxidase family protein n=1 Tax=Ilumatobacter sp. TaxID=1967498 RepID=UPI003299AF67
MPIDSDLALSRSEQDEILRTEWNMRISTTSPSGRSNVTPLWFVWHADQVWAYCRGQKVDNIRRDPRCTVLVDCAVRFRELRGIMIQGDARVLEDEDAERAEADLVEVRRLYGIKYHGGHGEDPGAEPVPMAASARGRSWRWVAITPVSTVTWDNTKLPSRSR